MAYLITQSLLSAWNYMHDCHDICEKEAEKDFLDTLNRVKKNPSPEMLNGISFENEVYARVLLDLHKRYDTPWENGIQAVADVLRDAVLQVKMSRKICVDGREFLVYGIADAVKAGTIYDVKFSNTNFASVYLPGKYLHSPQHSAYLYAMPEAREFIYLVSDGENLYTERYERQNSRPIAEIIREFMDYLEITRLTDVYEDKWRAFT